MSYFHGRGPTIIGAKAFHVPVRDGKEWFHFAMVVRQSLLACCLALWPGNLPLSPPVSLHGSHVRFGRGPFAAFCLLTFDLFCAVRTLRCLRTGFPIALLPWRPARGRRCPGYGGLR